MLGCQIIAPCILSSARCRPITYNGPISLDTFGIHPLLRTYLLKYLSKFLTEKLKVSILTARLYNNALNTSLPALQY